MKNLCFLLICGNLQTHTTISRSCVWHFLGIASKYTTSTYSCFTSKPRCSTHHTNPTLISNITSIHSTYFSSYFFALYEHIDHDLCEDPFLQILTFIPSPFRISSSPCYPWITKGKTTKFIKISLQTWWPFHIFKLMNWPEALTSLEGEILNFFLVFNYVSTLKNQTWKLETLPHRS